MRTSVVALALASSLFFAAAAPAQFQQGDPGGTRLGEAQTQRWKTGMIVTAVGGACKGIVGYVPVPVDWPEQQVTVVEEDISPSAKISYQTIGGTMKLMVVKIPMLPSGQTANALVTLEVKRHAQEPPSESETDQYVLPDVKKLPRDVREYLGPSPYIESRHPKIRDLAKEIGADKEKAWEQVEAVYDWVREKVEYKNGPLKGALAALKDGTGDCEELTSLFIAILRAKEIPARTVWVPGHCYPEFYLEDKEGKGHWFPCQAAGSPAFGGIPENRPILQKGDNFRLPDDPGKRVRYLPERVTGTASQGQPRVKWVREAVGK
ncbi:MAG: transglutaminase family protein [Planctomycetia bacterium]|nr:transglutaminase family protein [Planctomycetia bacterium]